MKRKYFPVLLIVLLLTLLVVTTVSATVGWGSWSGPTWTGSSYDFTVDANTWSTQRYLCINYEAVSLIDPFPVLGSGTKICTCPDASGCASYVGTWTCSIPNPDIDPDENPVSYNDADISWDIAGYANANCGGNADTNGPSGLFRTNPTAIELSSFEVDGEQSGWLSYASILSIALILLGSAVALSWFYKSRTSQK